MELARAAQCAPKLQSLFVEAVHIAHDVLAVSRDHFHDRSRASSVLVANARGFDVDNSFEILADVSCDHHQGMWMSCMC
eukprot:4457546-Pyramimonas_sp.AAC.1